MPCAWSGPGTGVLTSPSCSQAVVKQGLEFPMGWEGSRGLGRSCILKNIPVGYESLGHFT